MHDGHRLRLKDRFNKTGLQGFAEHEMLELILFYAIPRQDTNSIAHRLIQRFGNLNRVLSADVQDLIQVPGIGENSALLIHLFFEISKYHFSQIFRPKTVETAEKAAKYILTLLHGKINENFYLVCLDANHRIIHEELMCEGSIDSLPIYPRKIAATALRRNAASVIIAHNHPAGDPRPSKADIQTTLDIVQALASLGIQLSDHIIVAGDEYYCFSDTLIHKIRFIEDSVSFAAESSDPSPAGRSIQEKKID